MFICDIEQGSISQIKDFSDVSTFQILFSY